MNLIQINISASILIIFIIIVRSLFINKLPKNMFLILWGIVLCRFLIPFSIPINFNSSVNLENLNSILIKKDTLNAQPNIAHLNAKSSNLINTTTSFNWWIIIWIIGILLFSLTFLIIFLYTNTKLKTALPIKENTIIEEWQKNIKIKRDLKIVISDRITTPLSYGIFTPKIILPKNMSTYTKDQMVYILSHELIHIKRLDSVWKTLQVIAVTIYWFNPFVWIFCILMNRDLEISCDEKVLKCFGEDSRSSYAMSLISVAEQKNNSVLLGNGFSKNALEERITSIMKFKKTSFISLIIAILLTFSAITVFASPHKASTINTVTTSNINTVEIPKMMAPNSNIRIDKNMKITLLNGDYSKVEPKEEIILPNPEPGMNIFYDGSGVPMKIFNENNGLYYYMIDDISNPQYKGHTCFIVNNTTNSTTYFIDNKEDLAKAKKYLNSRIAEGKISKNLGESIYKSLETQIGKPIEIHLWE